MNSTKYSYINKLYVKKLDRPVSQLFKNNNKASFLVKINNIQRVIKLKDRPDRLRFGTQSFAALRAQTLYYVSFVYFFLFL